MSKVNWRETHLPRGSKQGIHIVATGILLGMLACSPAEPPPPDSSADTSPVVARIGQRELRAAELGAPAPDAAGRRRQLEEAITRVLAADEARQLDLAGADPKLAAAIAEVRREAMVREEALLRDALFAQVADAAAPTEEEVRAAYEATKANYRETQLTLRFTPASSRAEAEALFAGPAGAAAPGVETIGPAAIRRLPAKVLPEALTLATPGERAVAGSPEEGFGVIELVEILPAAPVPYEDAHERVARSLRMRAGQQAFRKRIEALRSEQDIQVFEKAE